MNDRYLEIAEDFQEPSVTSSDSNERKLARRLRIQRRLEALTKKADVKHEEIVEKNPIEKQILASWDILDNLRAEGDEVVSCVRVANDARELQRRREEQEIRRALLIKLEEDDRECMRKYEVINEKWSSILVSKDPLDIHAELKAQSDKCMEIMERKNAIITLLKQELERADMKFVDDQKNQHEDIDLLIDRMDNQMNVISKAYRRELSLIDDVIESERKMLVKNIIEKWEALYKKLQEDSIAGLDKRKDIMREYEEEMKRVMIEHQEEFRSQKITFELEIQELQQEVQSTKALCFMNIEKLDYSYAVLKQREDENAIVKNQQKRRINKLQDIVNELKKKYAELEESTKSEIQGLTDQVIKAHRNILDLMEKSDYFTNINDKKFMQIWDMNIKNANELLDKILTADKIIYEQALGMQWNPPQKILLKKEDLPSYKDIMDKIEKERKLVEEKKAICKSYKSPTIIEDINIERRLLNHILKHIVDHCDYLVEDRLLELLLPYTTNDKLVIKLDSVFQAFDIKCKEELGCLLNFFLPYAYCSTCINVCDKSIKSPSPEMSVHQSDTCDVCEKFTEHETRLIDIVKEAIGDEKSTISSDDVCSLTETSLPDVECTSVAIGLVTDTAKDDNQMQQRLLCDKGHLLEIETTFVTRALREFIERYHFVKWKEIPQIFQEKLIEKKAIASRNITIQDITDFWKRYGEIFSAKKERLWDSLLVGFKKYHVILKERHRLNADIESLRRQNAELRRLLKTYIIEPTSHELSQGDSTCEMR